jgi:thioredoxin reductase
MYDAIIVGAGPAGLNAALILGRCRRKVLVCDEGKPRNGVSRGVNGFITREGVLPHELRRIGREELRDYPSVEIRESTVVDDVAFCEGGGFEIVLQDGGRERARKLLLATGSEDKLPDIPGFAELYGHGVFNCPYCDGWEERDRPLAVYGRGKKAMNFALQLTVWSKDIVLCTDGECGLEDKDRQRLERHGITLREEKVTRLDGDGKGLKTVHFDGGEPLARKALFFITGGKPDCSLATKLGCQLTAKGFVRTVGNEETNVPGLFVAGDASQGVQFAIVAASEGALAAFEINSELIEDDLT